MAEQIQASPALLQTPGATFTRPADTTAYASGDLVANNTVAASVVAMTFAVDNCTGRGKVRRARIAKSAASLTNAQFRLHLYTAAPTATNGDNGVWLTTTSGYLGSLSMAAAMSKAFSDGAQDAATPDVGSEIEFSGVNGPGAVLYGLLEARGAYTPASAEVFTVALEIAQI